MAPSVKMKAKKPSKVVKPKADKRRTVVSTKNHRFQSFTERIANLKIDPIRRRRNASDRDELSEDTATYFGRALEEWRDLNLSSNFTAFAKDAAPLCENLPIVLHNKEKIMDLLVRYIEKSDSLSLEPLLDLLAHFARDLDIRFEEFFSRAVVTLTDVAANNADPAVIEWSFTRLAWLFKYLSRVLVPDLRPLYDLMAPYLGRDTQKPFIIRFAAESMSFLIRKSATSYDKNQTPLDLIIGHIFENCQGRVGTGANSLQIQGVMTMLTESMKGVQRQLHSSSLAIMSSIMKHAKSMRPMGMEDVDEILAGTLTGIIHHTDAVSFQPVLELILDFLHEFMDTAHLHMMSLSSRLLFVVLTTRKGSRVSDWPRVMKTLRSLLEFGQEQAELDHPARQFILADVAAAFQTTPIDALLPALSSLELARNGLWKIHFLQFCDLFSRLGRERFGQFLVPELQKFILEEWENHTAAVLFYVPRLAPFDKPLNVHDDFQIAMLERFNDLGHCPSLIDANAVLQNVHHVKTSDSFRSQLCTILGSKVRGALRAKSEQPSEVERFALGPCFENVLEFETRRETLADLWPDLCSASPRFALLPKFWTNILRYIKHFRTQQVDDAADRTLLESSIPQSLSLDSHDIRKASLEVAQLIYKIRDQPVPEALPTASAIESTPISLETSRSISMNIRKLASTATDTGVDSFTQRAIIAYCFGILHFQLAQAWEDAITTLEQLSKFSICDEAITSLTKTWLEMQGLSEESQPEHKSTLFDISSSGFQVESEFECPNLAKISAISQQVFEAEAAGYISEESRLSVDTINVTHLATNAREQALRVLNKIPNLAEKRSRMLVPVLLRWASPNETDDDSDAQTQRWSRKDQKSLLSIFAQFNNPKVLFKSAEVYEAMLHLCANGDVEIQRSALKAIFAWKNPAINSYEEHLLNLLDEARFRDQLSVFLQSSEGEDAIIRTEHREALMPVLLRLLYGRAVAGGKHGQGSRRKAIFVALTQYGLPVLEIFIDIALGPLTKLRLVENNTVDQSYYGRIDMSPRQQVGMLTMMNDMLETLGSDLEPFAGRILDAVLICTVSASRALGSDVNGEIQNASLLRSIRQTGQQCTFKIFAAMSASTFPVHAQIALDELSVPRQQSFAAENTQSISSMLRLLSVFASSQQAGPYLSRHSDVLLERLAELLCDRSVKDEVRIFVLADILDNLLRNRAVSLMTQEHVTNFVKSIGSVIKQQPSKDSVDACVVSLTNLASWIEDEQDGSEVITVCADLLTKPLKTVSLSTKTGLLRTLNPVLDLFDAPDLPVLHESLCGLFSRLHDLETRALLSSTFAKVCKADQALLKSARICEDLNAPGKRLDEPDHDRRERGFGKIFNQDDRLAPSQWLPILHNCLFYLRDDEDLVNRTSAARALGVFIGAACNQDELESLVAQVLLPGIEHGMKGKSELVRAEHLRLLGQVAETLPTLPGVSDMTKLTVSGDDEASFFTNVLHIQQHRRLRALRRLADDAGSLTSSNATKFFIPLLEHFVFDRAEGDSGRTLADQTISTIGALGKALSWSSFRATFKRYVGYLSSKPDQEAVIMRLLSALVDSISQETSTSEAVAKRENMSNRSDSIQRDLLPPLMDYIHLKDESTVDRRMPVAVTAVKLLLLLPKDEMTSKLAPVLTDVSHVLRSHSQEARDQTRKTLNSILALVGPAYLGFMLKELRTALQRGSQLHVLSFTVHSLLVNTVDSYQPGDLDYCLPELASIIMDDIFGATGQDKDSEDYRSKLKEVKSRKSFDTMELLARITPMQKLGQLVQPLRALLSESVDSKTLKKMDDLLTRLRNGVDQNPASQSRDALIFCHEIIRQIHQDQVQNRNSRNESAKEINRYIVQPERSRKSTKDASFAHSFKLVGFALGLLRKVLRRHEDLMTPANVTGFLPIVGDALIQSQEEIQVAAMKLLSTIMKLDILQLEENAPVYIKESIRVIKGSSGLTSDSPKAALELLTSILREKRAVVINEKAIVEALKVLKRDIDEPDKQGIIYKFLRSVLSRKLMATEVYGLMDEVGNVLVTNADRTVRESARSAYVQFILEYPHGKDRWNKQASFFVQNLKYEHASGRQSVMELLNQLLPKLPDSVVEQLAFTLFVALIPVQFSDSDHACRQMAGILIAKLFERAESEQMDGFLTILEKWTQPQNNASIQAAAFQCWTVALRTKSLANVVGERLRMRIEGVLSDHEPSGDDIYVVDSALQTLEALIETLPETAFAGASSAMWLGLFGQFSTGSADTRLMVSRLIEAYFSHIARSNSKSGSGLSSIPLLGAFGLQLGGKDMLEVCESSLQIFLLEQEDLNEVLAAQTVRNLVFLGRCFAVNQMEWSNANLSLDDDELEDTSKQGTSMTAIGRLFRQLSFIARQENLTTLPRISAVQCQIALIKHVDEIPDLVSIVKPLYLLTDPSIPKPNDESFKALIDVARELLEAVQEKAGSESYLSALNVARNYAISRREERRQKRKISAVSAPEKWAKQKKRKHDMQKAKHKANADIARGKRRGW